MKRAIRIIIPMLLAIAIVLCLVWYLFVYDREFTRDILLHSARLFENQGNHETASWFYDLAYKQAGDNDLVAIELAQQHKNAGNYTKAEYVLNQAISEGGSEELYIALCKTYVEQDKLLDAVKLLNTVCREDSTVSQSVKDALISKRPAAPISVPSPGYYSQYISVTLEAESGTLYASNFGQYPSVKTDIYTQPITLSGGENTIYAICVSDEGLVSPLGIFGFTVGGVIEEVDFADPAIAVAVRDLLGISNDTVVLTSDLWNLSEFTVPVEAKDYSDLKHMKNLEKLTIASGTSNQLINISAMTLLTELQITDTSVTSDELKLIGSLPHLEKLTLSGCGLSTTAGLKDADRLVYLDLSKNTIRNIDVLSDMKDLKELNLKQNAVVDLTPLSSCTSLSVLDVSGNALTSISPICGLSSLTKLNADNNTISQLGNIPQLTSLSELTISYNQLSDISAISGSTAIKTLNISNNSITDISALTSLPALSDLDFSYNQVSTLPKWDKGCALIRIDGSYNLLSDLSALSGLENLNSVYMDYNEDISSIRELADCHVLIVVSVYGTKVTEVKPLTDQSIIVHFNPTQA